MDRPGVPQVPEGSGEQGKMEKSGCKIICGAPVTLAAKGLMMMMMMTSKKQQEVNDCCYKSSFKLVKVFVPEEDNMYQKCSHAL